MSLMDLDNAETREDIMVPSGPVGEAITAQWEKDNDGIVTILAAIGRELAIDVKNNTN
jgi:hypothetical protein